MPLARALRAGLTHASGTMPVHSSLVFTCAAVASRSTLQSDGLSDACIRSVRALTKPRLAVHCAWQPLQVS